MESARVEMRTAPEASVTIWLKKFLLGGAFVLGVVWLFWLSRTWGFEGDGTLSYLGPFRPSYRLTLPAIPFDKSATYQYRFLGIPSENDMNLTLYIVGKGYVAYDSKDWQELENLKTVIEVTIMDGTGIICSASATPGGTSWPAGNTQLWVLTGGRFSEPGYWHKNCLHFGTSRKNSYNLTIRIKDVDPRSQKVVLVPKLEGGGSELP
jgi:hypothetical protein